MGGNNKGKEKMRLWMKVEERKRETASNVSTSSQTILETNFEVDMCDLTMRDILLRAIVNL